MFRVAASIKITHQQILLMKIVLIVQALIGPSVLLLLIIVWKIAL